ncbi:phosphate transporter [Bacillus gobiensis]|uniref:phosphate transporter n=1 Tax=Bacillus gobiensis TaxID=1441095 RepID=UPI003D256DFF
MVDEFYTIQEKYSLIISTNDKYNKEKREYDVISKTIKKVFLYLSTKYTLYIYYITNQKNRQKNQDFIPLNKFFSKKIIVIEPLDKDILNNEYILELFIFGIKDKKMTREYFLKEYRSINEFDEFLFNKGCLMAQVYDSSYVKIDSSDIDIIQELKHFL